MKVRLALVILPVLMDGAMAHPTQGAQIAPEELDKILERADRTFDEAKKTYEDARSRGAGDLFVEAGFKLEEARIKYLVLQEIGQAAMQKTAGDRIRSVNQLAKLIHDGRVAVTPSAPDSPGAKPPEQPGPAPGRTPPPASPAEVPKAPLADSLQRLAMPEAAKLREAEKQVKDLFKEQYARKSPEDRRALTRALLDQAAKSQEDPAALWVLLREAQDIAIQIFNAKLLNEALDELGRKFDVDSLTLRNAALLSMAKAAKSPEENSDLVELLDPLMDELLRADLYELADKAASLALQAARKSADPGQIGRMTNRGKEISEAKSLYQATKSSMEVLAKNPGDTGANSEMGKFLCYVKGSWDLGLRFLIKGSDASLKELAEKELLLPSQPSDRVALADGWFDLSEKEKSPLRKSRLLAHAKGIYESAVPDAAPLVRAKIEKRLDAIRSAGLGASKGPINLLSLIDVKLDSVKGEWTMEGRSILSPSTQSNPERLAIPYTPPDEYDLVLIVERRQGGESFQLMLSAGSAQFAIVLDASGTSGIDVIDGKVFGNNSSTYSGKIFPVNRPVTVQCAIRKNGINITADGKTIIRWQGNRSSLAAVEYFRLPDPKQIYVGCALSRFVVSKILLTPVSGEGRRLR